MANGERHDIAWIVPKGHPGGTEVRRSPGPVDLRAATPSTGSVARAPRLPGLQKALPSVKEPFNGLGNRRVLAEPRVALGNLSGAGFVGIVEALLKLTTGH